LEQSLAECVVGVLKSLCCNLRKYQGNGSTFLLDNRASIKETLSPNTLEVFTTKPWAFFVPLDPLQEDTENRLFAHITFNALKTVVSNAF